MKYIKIILSRGNPVSVSKEQAEKIFNSKNQMLNILDEKGKWTGEMINKSHIVKTEPDYERESNEGLKILKLDEPKNAEVNSTELNKIREKFNFKK